MGDKECDRGPSLLLVISLSLVVLSGAAHLCLCCLEERLQLPAPPLRGLHRETLSCPQTLTQVFAHSIFLLIL